MWQWIGVAVTLGLAALFGLLWLARKIADHDRRLDTIETEVRKLRERWHGLLNETTAMFGRWYEQVFRKRP